MVQGTGYGVRVPAATLEAPIVRLQILGVLGVDGLHLTVGGARGEERREEELRESVQRPVQVGMLYIKIEARVLVSCECVGCAAVLLQVALIGVLRGVLFGAQEKHVLQEICGARVEQGRG